MWESENQDESPLMTTDNFHGIDGLGPRRSPKLCGHHIAPLNIKQRKIAFGDGLKSSDMRGTYFRPAGHAMPSTDIWKPCSLLSNISKYGEKRRNFCDWRSNLPISHSTGTQTRLLSSFAERAPIVPIVRRSANGPSVAVSSSLQGAPNAAEDVYEESRQGQCVC